MGSIIKQIDTGSNPIQELREKTRKKRINIILIGLFILFGISAHAMTQGSANLNIVSIFDLVFRPHYLSNTQRFILLNVRLPRVIMAMVTGASLAAAGVIMQGVLQNPLASPFTLGVSSGASFGAAVGIVLGASVFGFTRATLNPSLVASNAFIFGCLSLLIVYAIGQTHPGNNAILLLSGVAVSSLFGAGVSALRYFSNNESLRDLAIWLMGGFWSVTWRNVLLLTITSFPSWLFLYRFSLDLNCMIAGDDIAKTSGVKVSFVRLSCLLLTTLIASASVAFSGVIGFVGLVAPHITRSILGQDYRYLLPGTTLFGALLLLVADTVARTIIAPVEIPVGIIMSLLGGPFFIYILIQNGKRVWN